MLVTSIRDGMNLVSYEFVACQEVKKGVLVLSEFAGAGRSLGAGALLVNPWNVTEVSSAIKEALNMAAEDREIRHRVNFHELNDTYAESELQIMKIPQQDVIQRYSQSKNRLIILGFFGTLTEPMHSRTKEMDLKLNPEVKGDTGRALCNEPKTTVVVLSRTGRNILNKGAAIDRILGEIVHKKFMTTPIDFVFCSAHFLKKDEDVYTFLESEILSSKLSHEPRSKSSNHSLQKKKVSSSILNLKKENYFSAAIRQSHTIARYFIESSRDVVDLLSQLAVADTTTTMTDSFSDSQLHQTCNTDEKFKRWINSVRRKELETLS